MSKIIFFGSYDPNYSRNLLSRKALAKSGYKIIECSDRSAGVLHHYNLIVKFLAMRKKAEIVFLPVTGHYDLPLAFTLAKIFRKKLIIDAFFSLYESYVEDRASVRRFSFTAFRLYCYDWLVPRLADKVIMDTEEHIKYFVKKYKCDKKRFSEIPVTADPDFFKHKQYAKRLRVAGFYGSFLPLHGVNSIVESAKILENKNILFVLAGNGPGYKDTRMQIKRLGLRKKVRLSGKVMSYRDLHKFLGKVDLFLGGPFGSTEKSQRVVTAKTIEALAMGVPTLVRESGATRRLLRGFEGKIIWLKENNSLSLAKMIEKYYKNPITKTETDFFTKSSLSFENFRKKLVHEVNK